MGAIGGVCRVLLVAIGDIADLGIETGTMLETGAVVGCGPSVPYGHVESCSIPLSIAPSMYSSLELARELCEVCKDGG